MASFHQGADDSRFYFFSTYDSKIILKTKPLFFHAYRTNYFKPTCFVYGSVYTKDHYFIIVLSLVCINGLWFIPNVINRSTVVLVLIIFGL